MTAAATSPDHGSAPADRFDFKTYLAQSKGQVEAALDGSLGPERPESLREAMRYSLLAGGKRLKPILCLAACELAGGASSPLSCSLALSKAWALISLAYSFWACIL